MVANDSVFALHFTSKERILKVPCLRSGEGIADHPPLIDAQQGVLEFVESFFCVTAV